MSWVNSRTIFRHVFDSPKACTDRQTGPFRACLVRRTDDFAFCRFRMNWETCMLLSPRQTEFVVRALALPEREVA